MDSNSKDKPGVPVKTVKIKSEPDASKPQNSASITSPPETQTPNMNILMTHLQEPKESATPPPEMTEMGAASSILMSYLQQSREASQMDGNMPGGMEEAAMSAPRKKKKLIDINTSIIPQVPTSEQFDELQGLDVDVYSHAEFQQNVIQQVDDAIERQEQEMMKKQAEKELNSIQDDIRSTKERLSHIKRAMANIPMQAGNKEIQRLFVSMKTQKGNKERQLKTLKARQKCLLRRIQGEAADLEDSDMSEEDDREMSTYANLLNSGSSGKKQGESEQERLIRLGEMTPFGSRIDFATATSTQGQPASNNSPAVRKPPEMTDFEKFLMQQDKQPSIKSKSKTVVKKKTVKKTDDPSKIKSSDKMKVEKKTESVKPEEKSKPSAGDDDSVDEINRRVKFMNERRNRSRLDIDRMKKGRKEINWKSLRPNWESDEERSDLDDEDDDDDGDDDDNYDRDYDESDAEYIPDERELKQSWKNDDYQSPSKGLKSRVATSTKSKKRNIEDDDGGDGDEGDEEFHHHGDDDVYGLDDIKQAFGVKAKKSRDPVMKKCVDDGNIGNYEKRLRKNKKDRLKKKKAKIDAGESDSEEDLEDYDFDGGYTVPGKIWHKLYKYQKTCVKWLWELHCQQTGGIVGDEMGLGKTIQIIAFLSGLKYSRLRVKGDKYVGLGPVLIVCPTTIMHQWVREFYTWYPSFRVAVFHESGSYSGSKEQLIYDIVTSRSVLVTSYSGVRLHQDLLHRQQWDYVILDEGHKIRNPDAEITQACKQFRTPHRIILSGSPVQNNLRELWSLFDFVFPGKLGTLPVFMQEFSVPITMGGYSNASEVQVKTAYKCACVLRDTINPYLLRRMKDDVKMNLNLPNKNEQVLFCRLTQEQVDVYQQYLDSRECYEILSGRYQVFAGLITLRKICNHADISTGGPKILTGEYKNDDDIPTDMQYGYWKKSGKMIVIESLLKLWKKQQHRVLLFSQSKQMLDILEIFVRNQGYNYMRMDGSTPISSRQPAINKYNNDLSVFVFLLTTRVGGLGVNLTGADRVVIYDPDWNPSTDTQARERAWRIGQTKQVTIYRLLTSGTIEEKIYHRQIFKQFLTNKVLKDPKQRRFFKTNDLYELFTLGNQDGKQGTETSAIFAGTGSDVRVKMGSKGRDKHSKVKRSSTYHGLHEHDRGEDRVKLKRSKTEPSELQPRNKAEHSDKVSSDNIIEHVREQSQDLVNTVNSSKDNDCLTAEPKNNIENGSKPDTKTHTVIDTETDTKTHTVTDTEMKQEDVEKATPKTSPSCQADNNGDGDAKRQLARKLAQQLSKSLGSSSGTIHKHGKKVKRNKKKRRKDAVIEGEKIANVDHHGAYQYANGDEEDTSSRSHDDYVLTKLLKKSGVHSALQHDSIMDAAHPDFVLVEGEAERVAKEATSALKQSRRRCRNARIGVPTWTGQSGAAGAPQGLIKPRFGQKVNGKFGAVSGSLTQKPSSPSTPEKKGNLFGKKKLFDGKVSGTTETNAILPSSTELLAKMRERNHLIMEEDRGRGNSDDEDDTTRSVLPIRKKNEKDELLEDMRNYVAFQASVDGEATTDEMLQEFRHKLPSNDSVVFKAMLQEICTFYRRDNGIGVWKLKPEYR
ncbi:DNA excision repair protein ERCC-6-like [Glandiceps talaboti]